jgi:hypothetical protein
VRIQLTNPTLVPELLEFLLGHIDCIATRTGEGELEASLLGSRQLDASRLELDRRLRAWQAEREQGWAEVRLV